ncbi:MAG: hypothetical protein LBE97_02150, partial [Holosporales bacterium]|nr:hypothetical protein [Holosporales bacterium]
MKGMLLQIKYIQILIIMTFLSGCNSAISEHIENRVAETTPETKDDSDIQAIIKNNEIKFDIPKGILKSIA